MYVRPDNFALQIPTHKSIPTLKSLTHKKDYHPTHTREKENKNANYIYNTYTCVIISPMLRFKLNKKKIN